MLSRQTIGFVRLVGGEELAAKVSELARAVEKARRGLDDAKRAAREARKAFAHNTRMYRAVVGAAAKLPGEQYQRAARRAAARGPVGQAVRDTQRALRIAESKILEVESELNALKAELADMLQPIFGPGFGWAELRQFDSRMRMRAAEERRSGAKAKAKAEAKAQPKTEPEPQPAPAETLGEAVKAIQGQTSWGRIEVVEGDDGFVVQAVVAGRIIAKTPVKSMEDLRHVRKVLKLACGWKNMTSTRINRFKIEFDELARKYQQPAQAAQS